MGKDWGKMHRQTVTLQGGSSFVVLAFFTVVASSPNLSTCLIGCKVSKKLRNDQISHGFCASPPSFRFSRYPLSVSASTLLGGAPVSPKTV